MAERRSFRSSRAPQAEEPRPIPAHAGVADLNSDGKSDIFFVDGSGTYASWTINDTAITGGGLIGAPGGTFTLLAPSGSITPAAPHPAAAAFSHAAAAMGASSTASLSAATHESSSAHPTLLAVSHA